MIIAGAQPNTLRREAVSLRRLRQAVLAAAQLQVSPQRARGHAGVCRDLSGMRQVLQRSRLPELAHEDPSESQGIRVRGMWEELQPARGLQHARAHTHGCKTASVRAMRQGVFAKDAAQATSQDPFRRAAVSVPGLPESVRRSLQHDPPHEATLRPEALPVQPVLQGLYQEAPPQDSP